MVIIQYVHFLEFYRTTNYQLHSDNTELNDLRIKNLKFLLKKVQFIKK